MLIIWLGALLVIGGLLYLVRQAIWRGRLSGPGASPSTSAGNSLEPPRRGLGFLGLGANWPGFLLIVIGAILLLAGPTFI